MQVSFVPFDHVRAVWPRVEGFMERAAARTGGRYTGDDVLSMVEDLGYQLWVAFEERGEIKGAVVTGIQEYPRKRALQVMFCGGKDVREWQYPMFDIVKKWAQDANCSCIESSGRSGWAKLFANSGYTPLWNTFEFDVGVGE